MPSLRGWSPLPCTFLNAPVPLSLLPHFSPSCVKTPLFIHLSSFRWSPHSGFVGGSIVEWAIANGPTDDITVHPVGVKAKAHKTSAHDLETQQEQIQSDMYDDRLKQDRGSRTHKAKATCTVTALVVVSLGTNVSGVLFAVFACRLLKPHSLSDSAERAARVWWS